MLIPGNEGKSCDAAVRHIEVCTGKTRTSVRLPEKDGIGPPVELRLMVGSQEYAIEHTLLQPYRNRIKNATVFNKINKFIRERVTDPLPGSVFYSLDVPTDVSLPRRNKDRNRALQSLVDWILQTAQHLHERRHQFPWPSPTPLDIGVNNGIRGIPDGFKCAFELFRWPDEAHTDREPGALGMRFKPPADVERPLRSAVKEAFAKKFPKLHACKAQGARTVLVLEGIDLPFWPSRLIGNHLPTLLAQPTDPPDEIYLVQPDREMMWSVWPVKRDEEHWPTTGMPELRRPYYLLGQRPVDGLFDWYREYGGPFVLWPPILPEWSPAFFKEEELADLTRNGRTSAN